MTLPDDNEQDFDLTPDLELPETDTPEVEEVEAEVTPPAPTVDPVMETVRQLAESMKADREEQRQRRERESQPAAPAAWVDPYDRPDVIAKLDDLEDRAGYDSDARNQLRTFRRQLDDERMDYRVGQREQALRAEMQAAGQVDAVTRTLRDEARQYGDLVTEEALTTIADEVFAGQPAHVRANALNDPALRKLIMKAAAGERVLNGQVKPPNAPARPAAPPAVRSDSRAPAPKAKAEQVQMWNDPAFLAAEAESLSSSKRRQTADHEELLA